jgi:hypothetical protein
MKRSNTSRVREAQRAARSAEVLPAHVVESQTRKGSDWEDFTYTHRDKDMIDPRPLARKIKAVVSNPETPWLLVLEIRLAVQLMLYAAGMTYAELVPLHVQFLAASQFVSDYSGGVTFWQPGITDRALAIIRAARLAGDAADAALAGRGRP